MTKKEKAEEKKYVYLSKRKNNRFDFKGDKSFSLRRNCVIKCF